MPPPIAPKAKKAPMQLGEPAVKIETPEVKARPKMPEKEKRRDYESEGEKKRQRYDYESLEISAVDRKEVPRELLYVQIGQQQWEVLGKDNRQRLLKEQMTSVECFFCGERGHRAYYCPAMLSLAVRIGRHLQQQAFGGSDRKQSLCCASCVFSITIGYVQQNQRGKYGSGWFNRTRSSCNWKSSCKLEEVR